MSQTGVKSVVSRRHARKNGLLSHGGAEDFRIADFGLRIFGLRIADCGFAENSH
jgi:hypothetical protein